MKLTNLQLGAACLLAAWAIFDFLQSISRMGIYVPIGSYQGMDRWRSYQEENKELLSIIDQLKGSTASHSERKTTRETSDVIGMWIDLTWEDVATICLLLSLYLLFSSQITRPQVSPPVVFYTYGPIWGYEDSIQKTAPRIQAQEIAKRRRRIISKKDIERQFGRSLKEAAAELQVSVSTFKRKCREHGIMRWPNTKEIFDSIWNFFDGENDLGTENDSIAETSETPTIAPVIHQSGMSTVYRSPDPLWSVQPQVPLTQMASENLGGPFVSMQPRVTQMATENLGSPLVFVQPQVPLTQMASENLGGPLVSMQPRVTQMASENLGSPLVSLQPQVPLTQMPSENLGSSDDGRTYLAQQDTRVVMIKAMYGKDTKLLFPFPIASGIIGLKGEVSKRLKFELDSFDIKYEDHDGDLILIACDEDLIFYLYVFKPLDDLVFKLVVIPRPRTEVNVADH